MKLPPMFLPAVNPTGPLARTRVTTQGVGSVTRRTLVAGATTCALVCGAHAQTTGAVAGGNASGANQGLETCDKTLGVLRIEEDTNANWYRYYGPRLGSTAPLLSMLIMQSNCFVIVERGTGERSISDETRRARGDEARESGTRGKGQQVVADYLMKPEIVMANKDNEGGQLGGLTRAFGKLGAIAGAVKTSSSEVGTVLTLVDIRSTVRLAAAEGYSKNSSFSLAGFGVGSGGALAGSAYSNTDEGKLVSAAFFDAYNKMVVALRHYKAQTVKGGLGEGGGLGVQGGITEASKKVGN
ncbi:MAG TPA: peptidoglycan-binding protein [Burkholderiaceae bacterium]|nr:peptidoglycan-binding protein [Burkholderiaceae bacterium]